MSCELCNRRPICRDSKAGRYCLKCEQSAENAMLARCLAGFVIRPSGERRGK